MCSVGILLQIRGAVSHIARLSSDNDSTEPHYGMYGIHDMSPQVINFDLIWSLSFIFKLLLNYDVAVYPKHFRSVKAILKLKPVILRSGCRYCDDLYYTGRK